jgi:hypothetical protein
MPWQISEGFLGDKLLLAQLAETSTADTSVHVAMTTVATLHTAQACFMSRIKRRLTSNIKAVFEKPRDM